MVTVDGRKNFRGHKKPCRGAKKLMSRNKKSWPKIVVDKSSGGVTNCPELRKMGASRVGDQDQCYTTSLIAQCQLLTTYPPDFLAQMNQFMHGYLCQVAIACKCCSQFQR